MIGGQSAGHPGGLGGDDLVKPSLALFIIMLFT